MRSYFEQPSDLDRAATQTINAYAESCEGNWKDIRKEVLRDIGFLFRHGGVGARMYAYALDKVFHELKPE
jgi:hypothetical protein